MRSATFIWWFLPAALAAQDAPSFSKDIAPIFAAHCIGCHAGNVKMGSLDLDTHESLLKGGTHGAVIVPGKSAESRLYLMVAGKMSPAMPLSGKYLAAGEIETIRKWIDAGAKPPAPGEATSISQLAKPVVPDIKPKAPVKPEIAALAWRPDGKLIALGMFQEVRLSDPARMRPRPFPAVPSDANLEPREPLAKRQPASGETIATLPGHAEKVRAVAFSSDGRYLAAAGGLPARSGEVKVWDIDKRAVVRTIQGHMDCIYAVAFSPDGKWLATSSYDKLIKVWDAETGKELRTLKDHIDAIYALAFTPDGKRLVSGAADRTVKIWDAATGERLYTLGEPLDGLNSIALDGAGKRVAAGGLDKTIRVWALGEKSGTLLNSLIAHEGAILRLAFSPDGKLLVSTSADRTIKVFKADDLTEIQVLRNQPDWALSLGFAPDGKSFAVGRFDGSLEIFGTPAVTAAQVAVR